MSISDQLPRSLTVYFGLTVRHSPTRIWWLSIESPDFTSFKTAIRQPLLIVYNGAGVTVDATIITRFPFVKLQVNIPISMLCLSQLHIPETLFSVYTQNYTLTNVCMSEMPVETSPAVTAQNCANICSMRTWCRSFNFIQIPNAQTCNYTCELFTWSVNDSPPNCVNTTSATFTCINRKL